MDDDIRQRLARLKGVEPTDEKQHKRSILFAKDTRSDQQKIDDMMKQFEDEIILDNETGAAGSVDPIKDIENRLAKLKGDSNVQSNKTSNRIDIPEEKDEITQVDDILKRVTIL